MLSKEQGITVIAVCIVYELFFAHKMTPCDWLRTLKCRDSSSSPLPVGFFASFQRVCVLSTTGLLLLLGRMRIMGAQLPMFTRFDNPAAAASFPVKQLSYNYLLSVNSWLLLNPHNLCCDWTMNTVPLVESLTDPRNISTLGTYAVLIGLGWLGLGGGQHASSSSSGSSMKKKKSSSSSSSSSSPSRNHNSSSSPPPPEPVIILVILSLIVFPFLPASNLFFPVGFVVAERILYLPSMGFCLLVAFGFHKMRTHLSGKLQLFWSLCLPLLLTIHATKTLVRNSEWRDELSIFSSGLKVVQSNAKLFNNVGHALEGMERYEEALEFFRHAVSVQPDDIGAHINVGRTLNHLERYNESELAYIKAKSLLPKPSPTGETYHTRVAPNHLNVFVNLATLISKNSSRLEEADSLYRQVISMRDDYTQAYINRGDVLIKLNRTKEAQAVYEKALTFESDNPDLLYNMAVVMLNQKKTSQALFYLDKALESDPEHPQALLNSAILIQESGSSHLRDVAIDRLRKIESSGKDDNERVYFNLGMLSMDGGNVEAAERYFLRAIEIKPDFRSALFNLALLLSETGRAVDSAPYLNQLIQHHPDHIKGLILLGDLYVNHLHDLRSAERCYRKILRLDPANVQGLHNLCVVMVEAGDLVQAKQCLQQASEMAPKEDYIRKHLQIVAEKLDEQQGGDEG